MKRVSASLLSILLSASLAFGDGSFGGVGQPGPAGADGATGPQGPAGSDGADGAPGIPGYSQNSTQSPCGVRHLTGLSFRVAACAYTIAGTSYSSPEATVTLDAADGSNPRIDSIIVNSSSVATKVTGTAAATPLKPTLDSTAQLELSFATIAAGASVPTGVSTTVVYDENNDWTMTDLGTSINVASTSNPHAGTTDIEGTDVPNGDYFQAQAGAPFDLRTFNTLSFYIRLKSGWSGQRSLTMQWFNNATPVGGAMVLRCGQLGLDCSNTSSYQLIAFPVICFVTTSNVDRLRWTRGGGSTFGFYVDDISLQGGVTQSTIGSASLMFRGTYSSAVSYRTNDVVLHIGSAWVATTDVTNGAPGTSSAWTLIGVTSIVNGTLTIDPPTGGQITLDSEVSGSNDVLQLGVDGSGTLAEKHFSTADQTGTGEGASMHINPGASNGANQQGATLVLSGGLSTGTGYSQINFMGSPQGASGSDPNTQTLFGLTSPFGWAFYVPPLPSTDLATALGAATFRFNGAFFGGDVVIDDEKKLVLREEDANGSNAVTHKAPASLAADTDYVWPLDDGDADQVLSTNGSGTLDWVDPPEGGGGAAKAFWERSASALYVPASGTADLSNRNDHPVIQFDASTDEFVLGYGCLERGFTQANGLVVFLDYMMANATNSGAVAWCSSFERYESDAVDLDSDSFGTEVCTSSTVANVSGEPKRATITHTSSEIDGLLAGECFRIKLRRNADGASPTVTDDAALDAQLLHAGAYEP